MTDNKPFGKVLTDDNYQALRKLALKLSYREFHETTGFGVGIHNRLRRFPVIGQYLSYIKENRDKYYPRVQKKRITLQDVYTEILEIKKLLAK